MRRRACQALLLLAVILTFTGCDPVEHACQDHGGVRDAQEGATLLDTKEIFVVCKDGWSTYVTRKG